VILARGARLGVRAVLPLMRAWWSWCSLRGHAGSCAPLACARCLSACVTQGNLGGDWRYRTSDDEAPLVVLSVPRLWLSLALGSTSVLGARFVIGFGTVPTGLDYIRTLRGVCTKVSRSWQATDDWFARPGAETLARRGGRDLYACWPTLG